MGHWGAKNPVCGSRGWWWQLAGDSACSQVWPASGGELATMWMQIEIYSFGAYVTCRLKAPESLCLLVLIVEKHETFHHHLGSNHPPRDLKSEVLPTEPKGHPSGACYHTVVQAPNTYNHYTTPPFLLKAPSQLNSSGLHWALPWIHWEPLPLTSHCPPHRGSFTSGANVQNHKTFHHHHLPWDLNLTLYQLSQRDIPLAHVSTCAR